MMRLRGLEGEAVDGGGKGGGAVCDEDDGVGGGEGLEVGEESLLGGRVEGGCGLVEQEDGCGGAQEGTGDGDALGLSFGEACGGLPYPRVEALRQVEDEFGTSKGEGVAHVGVGGGGMGEAEVGADGAGEEGIALGDVGEEG